MQAKITLPADLITTLTGGCTNSPGPWITLSPSPIILEDLEVTVLFDGGGTHDENVVRTVDLAVPLVDDPIIFPKQGVSEARRVRRWRDR